MNRPFKVKGGMAVGIAAVIIALFFITLYLPIGASSLSLIEWIIVVVWCLVGVVFYLNSLRTKNMYEDLRENAMYGNDSINKR
jgi:hypothetical protein